jgi:hypothetical protein
MTHFKEFIIAGEASAILNMLWPPSYVAVIRYKIRGSGGVAHCTFGRNEQVRTKF